MTGARAAPEAWRGGFFRGAALLTLVLAAGLGATGRFRGAIALTLGAAVAIVGALWLADLVRRFGALEYSAASRFNWNFAATGLLRYGLAALVLWGAVTAFPDQVAWLLLGTSVGVLAAVGHAAAGRPEKGSGRP